MTRVNYKYLINLSFGFCNLGTRIQSRRFNFKEASTTQINYTSNSSIYTCSPKHSGKDPHHHTDPSDEKDDHSQSFNSSQQKYHRQQYERKRSEHQNSWSNHDVPKSPRFPTSCLHMSHYQRLNIHPDADLNIIKSAYYSLSKIYHPDIVGTDDSNAVENFRLITESYDTLSDPKLRSEYDNELNLNAVTMPDFYNRQKHVTQDYNLVFKSKNADLIFKLRQDAALQREKEKNPQKFRAGVFVRDENSDDTTTSRLSDLNERLKHMKTTRYNTSKIDGSEFYRMHMYNIIQRRQSDLEKHIHYELPYETRSQSYVSNTESLLVNLSVIIGTVIFIVIIYVGQKLGPLLDNKMKKSDEKLKNDIVR